MQRVPGAISADLLIGLGLTREDVVRGLVREIQLTRAEAERAWTYAVAKNATDYSYPLAVLDVPA
jgi:hypothetical protein